MGIFAESLRQIDTWVEEGAVKGVAAAVWHRGEIVDTLVAGDARPGEPVTNDTLFALASVTKPVTVATVMTFVDSGDIALDDPVASLLPAFGDELDPLDTDVLPQLEIHRDEITLRQILCHVSGLPENVSSDRLSMRNLPSLETLLDAMCRVPLQSAPGERLRYSNVGIGVAARLVEHLTGKPFAEVARERVIGPMNLPGIVSQPSGGDLARIAHTDDPGNEGTPAESYNSAWWQDVAIPWGGYFGTATDLATFAASFFPEQQNPLSPEVKSQMIIDQTGGVPGGVEIAGVYWHKGAWGLGWEVASTKRHHWTGTLRSPSTFCHWGQAGTLVWADPERKLALAVFGNRAVRVPWPLKPPRWSNLSNDLVTIADQS